MSENVRVWTDTDARFSVYVSMSSFFLCLILFHPQVEEMELVFVFNHYHMY